MAGKHHTIVHRTIFADKECAHVLQLFSTIHGWLLQSLHCANQSEPWSLDKISLLSVLTDDEHRSLNKSHSISIGTNNSTGKPQTIQTQEAQQRREYKAIREWCLSLCTDFSVRQAR